MKKILISLIIFFVEMAIAALLSAWLGLDLTLLVASMALFAAVQNEVEKELD